MKQRMLRGCLALVAAFCMAFPAWADLSSSANYSAPPGPFSGGGGQAGSAGFQQTGVLGAAFVAGSGSSSGYSGATQVLPNLIANVPGAPLSV